MTPIERLVKDPTERERVEKYRRKLFGDGTTANHLPHNPAPKYPPRFPLKRELPVAVHSYKEMIEKGVVVGEEQLTDDMRRVL